MKIALVRRQFSPTGGAELYLKRLLEALLQGGHEIHLFAENWASPPAELRFHPVPVQAPRAWRSVRFAEAVQQQLAAEKFDCVFSLDRTLKQDVYRAGDGLHRVWLERRRQFAPWWRKPFVGLGAFHRNMMDLEARTFDPANTGRIIVNSEMVKGEILRHFRFPEDRIHLVRNGVEVARLRNGQREETRRRFGFAPRDYVLLFVGSGWERKGLAYVLQALRKIQWRHAGIFPGRHIVERRPLSVKLLVVGHGKRPAFVPRDVVFAGPMTDLENAYAAADLFVFPPIYEPSANVVAEALAAGLPVITSAQNGASEWIAEGQTGSILAAPDDITLLARKIMHWLARLPLRLQLDPGAFSLERNVQETLAVLKLPRPVRS